MEPDIRVHPSKQRAWWVHPATGRVLPVTAHAKTIAEQPETFGLTRADVARAGATPGFNYYDAAEKSPRRDLIHAATRNGWVRVRKTGNNQTAYELHTNAGSKVVGTVAALRKHGATEIERGGQVVEDPAHGFAIHFRNADAAVQAARNGSIPETGAPSTAADGKSSTVTDTAKRALLRSRINRSAGIDSEAFEERRKS